MKFSFRDAAAVATSLEQALVAFFDPSRRWLTAISRAEWLMADEPSGVGEVVMLGPGVNRA